MFDWAFDAVFYHIYPLGLCGAPERNDFHSPPVERLAQLHGWLDHIQALGANAIYLGPLFESSAHGYDTVDYYHVDRRLGNNDTLARLSEQIHRRGMRLVLDAVFNHVGRDFWAFHDLRQHGERSAYHDWFHNLKFGGRSPYNDPFTYDGWSGHHSLVKLNLHNPVVKDHLFEAVRTWVERFGIDGLRLDAADVIDPGFLSELAAFGKALRPDFWLLGEVVHGDYRAWVNPQRLDSVTNYECYKGLYSSLNDRNYFEIAYALKRQFAQGGIYAGLPLYNFADNHDVNRVASSLREPGHLYPLYGLLFTMPGAPSIYYGSEWGLKGQRSPNNDRELRPALSLEKFAVDPFANELKSWIRRLAQVRRQSPALRRGAYQELHVSHEQFAFLRSAPEQQVVVAINASGAPADLALHAHGLHGKTLQDLLQPADCFAIDEGRILIAGIPPHGMRILTQLMPVG